MGGETKSEAEPLPSARGSITYATSPLSLWVQQGTTWYHFYEMLCFPDPKYLSSAGKRDCLHSPDISGHRNEATYKGAQIAEEVLVVF